MADSPAREWNLQDLAGEHPTLDAESPLQTVVEALKLKLRQQLARMRAFRSGARCSAECGDNSRQRQRGNAEIVLSTIGHRPPRRATAIAKGSTTRGRARVRYEVVWWCGAVLPDSSAVWAFTQGILQQSM